MLKLIVNVEFMMAQEPFSMVSNYFTIIFLSLSGIRCDSCDNNHFGNPVVPGGFCELCNCNNNIDPGTPGNCNALSGQCMKCLYNTGGYNCDQCKPGYYGDALQRTCRRKLC